MNIPVLAPGCKSLQIVPQGSFLPSAFDRFQRLARRGMKLANVMINGSKAGICKDFRQDLVVADTLQQGQLIPLGNGLVR
jgi:hypothetical protein